MNIAEAIVIKPGFSTINTGLNFHKIGLLKLRDTTRIKIYIISYY